MRQFPHCWPVLLATAGCLVGCGGGGDDKVANEVANDMFVQGSVVSDPIVKLKTADETRGAETNPSIDRKIVYTAEIDLVVEDYSKAVERVEELVKRYEGRVANSREYGVSGERRSGVWTLRIPVTDFESFLDDAVDIGELRSKSRDSEDVTEEFYDIQARLRNRKAEEQRLLKILADQTGKLEDVLAVERELSRIRESIETMEGRLKLLNDLISMTTVTIRIEEIKDYVPEQTATFGTRIDRSWTASLTSLRNFGANSVIVLIVAGPWLVVLGVPLFGVVWIVRRRSRRRGRAAQPAATTDESH